MSRADLGERWQRVFDDTEATAAEYRDRGWEALALHPGDVNPIADEARLHVLLPGSEFDEVNELLSEAAIGSVRVYAAAGETVSYRLVVAEDATAEIAVCLPTYVLDSDEDALEAAAADAGQLTLRLRPLDDRDRVEFAVDDPALFFRDPAE
ncbi:hypothetical protein DJ69_04895 [Halorubrum persicum]|uniref:Uncharacterized protein n=1 Tax=Halorubrum persicum TaxID=1383844 RepID=A0A2G1WL37_9EURY|nr:hypothetical protein [Halorubrum persicum]PHQ39702.1 hypothetical protein DJ69_04895 [Halorubrum persicum]